MNKKIMLFSGIIIITILAVTILQPNKKSDFSDPEKFMQQLLVDIFDVDYNDYLIVQDMMVTLPVEEYTRKARFEMFSNYVVEDKRESFLNNRASHIHFFEVINHKLDINLKSYDLDIRETKDSDVVTVFATIEYEVIFTEDDRNTRVEIVNAEFTLTRKDKYWLMSYANLNLKTLGLN